MKRRLMTATAIGALLSVALAAPGSADDGLELDSTSQHGEQLTETQALLQQSGIDFEELETGNVLVYGASGEPALVLLSEQVREQHGDIEMSFVGNIDQVPADVMVVLPDVPPSEKLLAVETMTGLEVADSSAASCTVRSFATVGTAFGSAQNFCRAIQGASWTFRVYYHFRVGLTWNYGACMQGEQHWRVIDPLDGSFYVAHGFASIGCANPSVSSTTGSLL